jgi:hypothetical protein
VSAFDFGFDFYFDSDFDSGSDCDSDVVAAARFPGEVDLAFEFVSDGSGSSH